MQNEQRPISSAVQALRDHLAEVKAYPQEKREEYWDTLNNKDHYKTSKRALTYIGTDEELLTYTKHAIRGASFSTEDELPLAEYTLEEAKSDIASHIYRMERESADDFKESFNGMVYLDGFEPAWLKVEEFETPQPADKVAKYFLDSNE